jgi:hypothetical protein
LSLREEFKKFELKINQARSGFLSILNNELRTASSSGRLFGYGACATSTTLLHHWDIGKLFYGLIDDNPRKKGTYSPGYHLKVYCLEEAVLEANDVVVVLAWRYASLIREKLQSFTGRIIIPLPSPQLI